MKKMIPLLGFAALALMGCDAKADNQNQAEVGNPGSANMVIVEEGYVVETAPAGGSAAPAQNQNTQQPAAPASATVTDEITAVETPDAVAAEEDITVTPND